MNNSEPELFAVAIYYRQPGMSRDEIKVAFSESDSHHAAITDAVGRHLKYYSGSVIAVKAARVRRPMRGRRIKGQTYSSVNPAARRGPSRP